MTHGQMLTTRSHDLQARLQQLLLTEQTDAAAEEAQELRAELSRRVVQAATVRRYQTQGKM